MKTIITLCTVAAIAVIGCGDNKAAPDAKRDSRPADAYCSNCPAAPAVGAQIDRMGRPAINTALNRGFEIDSPAKTAAKDVYNQNGDMATWITPAQVGVFMKSLAFIDVLDSGMCKNGICEAGEGSATCAADCGSAVAGTANGCGNQALYNGKALGDPGNPLMTSYAPLAALMADDELYLDTSKTICMYYLAVEFGVATGQGNSTCGGRAPQYDVMDFTLSLGAMGVYGFDIPGGFVPQIKDNAPPHTDYLADFPYLGDPH